MPRFDRRRFGRWNDRFNVPIPENDEIVKRGIRSGCPFNWVIDYIEDFNDRRAVREEETKTFLSSFFDIM